MNQQELEELLHEQNKPGIGGVSQAGKPNGHIGLMIADPVSRRLLEGLSIPLDLRTELLDPAAMAPADLVRFELLIADEGMASKLHVVLRGVVEAEGTNRPALVAVRSRDTGSGSGSGTNDSLYEGVVLLPDEPNLITAQLGVILYAHRAYLRRYRDALEELQLNRRIFRSVTSGITVARAEPDFPLIYVNPAFELITGYSIEESLGRNCRFLQAGERDQPGLTLLREALRHERETKVILRNYRKDGTPFWNELSISPIRNYEGRLTHLVGIQQDVTSRVEFEEALRASEKLATAGRLAASIAHEINNPLEAVTNLIYLARHAESMHEVEDHLSLADEELRRVALLTSQSLRFYKQSTAPQAVRATNLFDSVLDVYGRRLEQGSIQVERRERTCDSIVCFESEIRQVLSNLVRNSMDAMKGGGRLLARVRAATNWRDGTRGVMLTVADTGSGMSAEVQSRIFEAFYSTKGNSGTGLGLWVTSEIVMRHKGQMRVRSRDRFGASGTVFELFLPYEGLAPKPQA